MPACPLTVARLVATGDQHPPLLGLRGALLDGPVQGILPVIEGQDLQLLGVDTG
jgi:hypothetical protein